MKGGIVLVAKDLLPKRNMLRMGGFVLIIRNHTRG